MNGQTVSNNDMQNFSDGKKSGRPENMPTASDLSLMKANSMHLNPNASESLMDDAGVAFNKQRSNFTPNDSIKDGLTKNDNGLMTIQSSASDSSHKSSTKRGNSNDQSWHTSPRFDPVPSQLNQMNSNIYQSPMQMLP